VKPFVLADIGEGIAEVELLQWFVNKGDKVKSFDKICEVQSDKATVEITSRYDGVILDVKGDVGSIIPVGSTLVDIEVEDTVSDPLGGDVAPEKLTIPNPNPMKIINDHQESQRSGATLKGPVLTTPSVRKYARENNIDLNSIQGSGPKGRIRIEDVKFGSSGVVGSNIDGQRNAPITPALGPLIGNDEVVPIRGVQRLMVKSMDAANKVQHLTYHDEVQVNELISIRSSINSANSDGMKLSYLPFIMKAVSLALSHYPALNATVSSDATEMTLHSSHNLGIAMDTPKGLVVPVVRNIQDKSISSIAAELDILQKKSANGKLTEDDLRGGTFTISNIGSIGGTYAVPVIVVPQVVILALGKFQVVPKYVNEKGTAASFEDALSGSCVAHPTPLMNISLSADHRVVDGASVARFSNLMRKYLQSPSQMLTDLR
jgi:2-oxoisovalerate dehydrogenase E2 component (dihydrolipoyl transacylase)